jgi:small redox-active disulfide protein 2
MNIKVLGPGCGNCVRLEQRTREALTALGRDADIDKVTDYGEMLRYGIMQTPALVVDGQVVVSGKVPTTRRIQALLGG